MFLDIFFGQESLCNLPDLRSSPDVAWWVDSCQSREDSNDAQVHYRDLMTKCEASYRMSGVYAYVRELHQICGLGG